MLNRRETLRLLALSCASTAAAAPFAAVAQTALPHVRVVGAPNENMTDLFYAIKSDAFARNGLTVEFVSSNNGAASTAAVVSGTYEVAETSLLALFSAHVRDIPVVLIEPGILSDVKSPRSFLLIASDSPYKTGADLNGKVIASPSLNDLGTLTTKAWVDKNHGDWHSLKFVEIPNSALIEALVQHRVDAAVVQTPQLDIALASGVAKPLAFVQSAVAPAFFYTGYIARRDWVTQQPDVVRRFVETLRQAATYVNAHHAETAPVVAEFTKVAVTDVNRARRSTFAGEMNAELVQPLIDTAQKYGQIPRTFPAHEIFWTSGK